MYFYKLKPQQDKFQGCLKTPPGDQGSGMACISAVSLCASFPDPGDRSHHLSQLLKPSLHQSELSSILWKSSSFRAQKGSFMASLADQTRHEQERPFFFVFETTDG